MSLPKGILPPLPIFHRARIAESCRDRRRQRWGERPRTCLPFIARRKIAATDGRRGSLDGERDRQLSEPVDARDALERRLAVQS
jgi:hypothetical protein